MKGLNKYSINYQYILLKRRRRSPELEGKLFSFSRQKKSKQKRRANHKIYKNNKSQTK
jgi:hypothetical protein